VNAGPTISAEWLKLRTVRSTVWTLLVTIVLCVGIGALISLAQRTHWPMTSLEDRLAFNPIDDAALSGFLFAPLAIGVIGVLIISSEYSSGSIRSTLGAQPRRVSVLVSKAIVLFATTLVVGEVCSFASFYVGMSILGGVTPTATLSSPGALRAVLLAGLSLALLALFALGIGTMLRHTAGSITVYVCLLLVLLIIVSALPSSWNTHVFKYLPEILAATMRSTPPESTTSETFSPWVSTLVLSAYALAALIGGGVLLSRRDA
jgi:ABC-2 type transport system permease protein